MDWFVLGIEPTKDKKAITAAYRQKLRQTNPEDKPEEFKALRTAYEEAIAFADQADTGPVRDESPVGLWMEAIAKLYEDYAARINPVPWKELMSSDVCIGLDTRPAAEEALLKFLLENYSLPKAVWQVLDETFQFSARAEELYETWPREFIDHAVLSGIRFDPALDYELFTPGKNGKVNPVILAAAEIAGIDRIFKVGGAQAVAALAYGTESVPKVDKIVGPGNAFVAEAKKQVFGMVAIDMIAGPSEILVLADGRSDPRVVAADLLSQAEHDRSASAVLVTESMELAKAVQLEVEVQLERLPRRDIARTSVDQNGMIIVADDLSQGIEVANRLAPEHLELMVDDPFAYLDSIRNAGSVFLGRSCPEALGDYFAGPNHTLPTSGTARFSSPLGVDDFVKKSQFLYYTPEALDAVAEDVAKFARKEGLEAHARSALVRK